MVCAVYCPASSGISRGILGLLMISHEALRRKKSCPPDQYRRPAAIRSQDGASHGYKLLTVNANSHTLRCRDDKQMVWNLYQQQLSKGYA